MSFFPYETVSEFFEAEGDFPENQVQDVGLEEDLRLIRKFNDDEDYLDEDRDLAEEEANQRLLDEQREEAEPDLGLDLLLTEREDVKWFINEDGATYPYPATLQEKAFPNDFHVAYASEEEAEAASAALGYVDEPCCYNSSRNFGTGEHEYGCPNY
jgi:hypothetical protein